MSLVTKVCARFDKLVHRDDWCRHKKIPFRLCLREAGTAAEIPLAAPVKLLPVWIVALACEHSVHKKPFDVGALRPTLSKNPVLNRAGRLFQRRSTMQQAQKLRDLANFMLDQMEQKENTDHVAESDNGNMGTITQSTGFPQTIPDFWQKRVERKEKLRKPRT